MKQHLMLILLLALGSQLLGQDKFAQLEQLLPTPNTYRTASGAPGPDYYQVRADYKMDITLDDGNQRLYGEETITFHNSSPDKLEYLWLQLDQNVRAKDSDSHMISPNSVRDRMSTGQLESFDHDFDGGFKIDYVQDKSGKSLKHVINKTMMRIDSPQPLKPGDSYTFKIKWWYNINDRMKIGGRSGYEYFEGEDNYLYTIAQYFPRMCSYNDVNGWQNKQFLGRGEFALIFGDYDVNITVPEDHLVAATGELKNMSSLITPEQKKRYDRATKSFDQPVIVCTQSEAEEREKVKKSGKKTWKFSAKNVRDFAFASSRKFIWDAMAVKVGSKTVMAMSMYPKEGNPLWERYSTKAVAQTLITYSKHTFDYPYPVAWSINAKRIGMEYPMICFNFGRTEDDGTYSENTKYRTIGVIIHEVGHNFFPMIVNSDERQWTWMDEGLNTFLQYLTEQEFERGYPSRRGPAYKITDYMKGDKSRISPIMTNSESIYQFGNNAYGKPATALNILRETILGRELFDHAFRTYAQRWMFKSPEPADLFRTLEDASGVDLDWFWRGWFYTTEHVDIAMTEVKQYKANPQNPDERYEIVKEQREEAEEYIGDIRNREDIKQTYNEKDPTLNDFYTTYDDKKPDAISEMDYEKMISNMSEDEKELLNSKDNFYEMSFENVGGLPMPIIINVSYVDGTSEKITYPAEIWRFDRKEVTRVLKTSKEVTSIVLDPNLETADVDRSNNYYPARQQPSRFEIFKQRDRRAGENPMQRSKRVDTIKP